jgi:glycosyltransferase involved in cell wall biosynthesis
VVIDADLQDPPELIPQMIEHWQGGFDVVYAQRTSRAGESAFKKTTAHLFYRLMQQLSRVQIPHDVGDFRLLSRRAVDALAGLREQHRFMKGLFAWIGYPQKAIPYERDARYGGATKWSYIALWNFAIEGITSFSTIPLKVATYLGMLTAFGAFLFGMFIVVKTLFFGNPVPGYPSLLVVMLFLGGIQLMALGVIGEYLGRMFDETKGRPLYLLNSYEKSNEKSQNKNKV